MERFTFLSSLTSGVDAIELVNVNIAEGLAVTIAIMFKPSSKLMLPLGIVDPPERMD